MVTRPCLSQALGHVAWLAQRLLIRVVVVPAQVQGHDMIDLKVGAYPAT
jgi:hypothetical protein